MGIRLSITASDAFNDHRRNVGLTIGLIVSVMGFMLAASSAFAQNAADRPAYKLFRYDEDYRYLAKSTHYEDFWDPIKYIPIGKDTPVYLSVGGELRERMEYYSPFNFGFGGSPPDAYVLHRALLQADLHATEYFRAFLQIGSYFAISKNNPAPPYEDRIDLQQAFVDFRLPIVPADDPMPTIRFGRQEIGLGSQRIVAIRDAPNVRFNFDGFRLIASFGNVSIDGLAMHPVRQNVGAFDNPSNWDQSLWGLYSTVLFKPGLGLDLYYLGFENGRAAFAGSTGNETRQSIGARFFGAARSFDWDWEALWQFGSFAGRQIRAWTVSSNSGYTFTGISWTPRIGLKADIASGDETPGGSTVGTFNALFPKLAYFNQAALLAPANIIDVQPSLTLRPGRDLTMTVGWDFLWRQTTQDAVYVAPFTAVPGTAGRGSAFIGHQVAIDFAWQLERHVLLEASYVHFTAGDTLRSAGANNVDFLMFAATYKF